MSNEDPQAEVDTAVQRVIREGSLIASFLLALFLLIALLSYAPEDPGFTTTGSGQGVDNAVGVYGAWIADVLLHLVGYLAYCLPLLLVYKIYSSYRTVNSTIFLALAGAEGGRRVLAAGIRQRFGYAAFHHPRGRQLSRRRGNGRPGG
ncbi:MAG: DNA translocase FtsK 4TM domain-containing protein [Pseudohongiellaceae bacterium]